MAFLQGLWQAFTGALTNLLSGGRFWQAIGILAIVYLVTRLVIAAGNLWKGREGRTFIDMTKFRELVVVVLCALGVLMAFQLTGGSFVIPALGINVQGGAANIDANRWFDFAEGVFGSFEPSPSGVPFWRIWWDKNQLVTFDFPDVADMLEQGTVTVYEDREVLDTTTTITTEIPGFSWADVVTITLPSGEVVTQTVTHASSPVTQTASETTEHVLNPGRPRATTVTTATFIANGGSPEPLVLEGTPADYVEENLEVYTEGCSAIATADLVPEGYAVPWKVRLDCFQGTSELRELYDRYLTPAPVWLPAEQAQRLQDLVTQTEALANYHAGRLMRDSVDLGREVPEASDSPFETHFAAQVQLYKVIYFDLAAQKQAILNGAITDPDELRKVAEQGAADAAALNAQLNILFSYVDGRAWNLQPLTELMALAAGL